jgi:hypothetical protein
LGIGPGLKGTVANIYDMKKSQLEKEAHNTRKERAREVEERKRTSVFASPVSFLGFHAAINQPKGMLQSKKVCWSTH